MSAIAPTTRRHAPRYRDALPVPPENVAHQLIYTATAVAARFSRGTPTAADLMREFGMSKATAHRWRSAMKAARGEP